MSAEEPTLKDVWQSQQELRQSLKDMWQSQQDMRQSQQDMRQSQQDMWQSQQDMRQSQQEMWRLLGSMNRRFSERFDVIERELIAVNVEVSSLKATIAANDAKVTVALGALKESIEARDFRLDEHGRRLTALEEKLP